MMEYLAPVLRNHFNLLYRFGYTHIPKSILIELQDGITETTKQDLVSKFKSLSPFEYDEEYLILKISNNCSSQSDNLPINVQDVLAIYPLSHRAKQSIESKIDNRIKLEEPIFESFLPEIEANIEKSEIQQAINALWKLCKIEGSLNEIESAIGIDNLFEGLNFRKIGVKAANIEGKSYWTHLIAYERYEYFPKGTIGYFYDAGEVFSFCKGKTDGIVGTKIYDLLENIKKTIPQASFNSIVSELENNPLSQKYIAESKSEGIRNYIVAPLFLRWKEELRNGEVDLFDTTIFSKKNKEVSFINQYPVEVKAAIILLAVFFGFKRFYDNYYDSLNLKFFKAYNRDADNLEDFSSALPYSQPSEEKPAEVALESQSSLETLQVKSETSHGEEEKHQVPPVNNELGIAEDENSVSEQFVDSKDKNESDNDFQKIVIDILNIRQDISLTDLSKELDKKINRRLNNEAIENIIKEMPELEEYKEKRTKKVRLKKQLSLIND